MKLPEEVIDVPAALSGRASANLTLPEACLLPYEEVLGLTTKGAIGSSVLFSLPL
jgi:hypothetical protein